MKKFEGQWKTTVTKVDLSKPSKPIEENEIKEDNPVDEGVVAVADNAEPAEKQEEVQPEAETQETPVLEEITEEEIEEVVQAEEAISRSL